MKINIRGIDIETNGTVESLMITGIVVVLGGAALWVLDRFVQRDDISDIFRESGNVLRFDTCDRVNNKRKKKK